MKQQQTQAENTQLFTVKKQFRPKSCTDTSKVKSSLEGTME